MFGLAFSAVRLVGLGRLAFGARAFGLLAFGFWFSSFLNCEVSHVAWFGAWSLAFTCC